MFDTMHALIDFIPDSIAHIPTVLIFDDFVNLVMLLNYAELVLVVTPARYSSPSSVNFQQTVYQLPHQRSCKMHCWLLENFRLLLDPPVEDGYNDDERLDALLLKSLLGQAHTLWASVKRRQELGVVGAKSSKGRRETQITHSQVLSAISKDLSDFPGFSMWKDELLNPAPTLYSWPAPPDSSHYVLRRKV